LLFSTPKPLAPAPALSVADEEALASFAA
jgi:hypothetical protein